MNVIEHFELHPYVHLEFFGIDMSINKAVIMMWIACALIFAIFLIASRKRQMVPRGLQNVVEAVLDFLRLDIVMENIGGKEGRTWMPFITTLFFFIFFCNILGLLPGAFTATSNINVTATLAIIVFLAVQIQGVIKHGPIKYIKGWVPSGIPVVISIIMFPIEVVGQLAKPFSLAVRLFANMFAGHVILLVFLYLILYFKSIIIAPFPLLGVVAMSMLEILFSGIQAYIFVILSSMYIGVAIHAEH